MTTSVKLPTDVCRLGTILGSNSAWRSRGVSISISPKSPRTVFRTGAIAGITSPAALRCVLAVTELLFQLCSAELFLDHRGPVQDCGDRLGDASACLSRDDEFLTIGCDGVVDPALPWGHQGVEELPRDSGLDRRAGANVNGHHRVAIVGMEEKLFAVAPPSWLDSRISGNLPFPAGRESLDIDLIRATRIR